jgi:hypothetical protein
VPENKVNLLNLSFRDNLGEFFEKPHSLIDFIAKDVDGRSALGDGKTDSLPLPVRRSLDNPPADVEKANGLSPKVNVCRIHLPCSTLRSLQHDGNQSIQ